MIVTADDLDQLLTEMPVTSKEFGAEGGELRDGKLRKLMGFTFVEMETENPLFWNAEFDRRRHRATARRPGGSEVRHHPRAVVGAQDLDRRAAAKAHSRQVYAASAAPASRTDSGKVGYILNKRN
jgi:hypothetical protein